MGKAGGTKMTHVLAFNFLFLDQSLYKYNPFERLLKVSPFLNLISAIFLLLISAKECSTVLAKGQTDSWRCWDVCRLLTGEDLHFYDVLEI